MSPKDGQNDHPNDSQNDIENSSRNASPTQAPSDAPPAAGAPVKKRSRFPLLLGAGLALAGATAGLYYYNFGRFHVSTDDAYVNGDLVRLTPQISGTIVAIEADQTQFVKQGQPLVRLQDQDSEVALAQAEANLAQTAREVAELFAGEQRDAATVSLQRTQLERASDDLKRDESLAGVHGVSKESLDHDQQSLRSAQAALAQAQASLAMTRAAIAGTTPATHPRVLAAEAALRTAWLNNSRTSIRAPVSGYIVRRAVQLGQQVTPGTELMAIVPVDSVWVDANFKETQLGKLRIGQPVSVEADMYGSRVSFRGHLLGLAAGTGSALAVLPAQNASGNWVKIVQRLPVRIGLDPGELAAHPLFVGLSTSVKVDAHNLSGAPLSEHPVWDAHLATPVYETQDSGAGAQIEQILRNNLAAPDSPRLAATPKQEAGS